MTNWYIFEKRRISRRLCVALRDNVVNIAQLVYDFASNTAVFEQGRDMRFSANLGFLWNDRPLPKAIHAAAQAGFDAVECHWPYEVDPADVHAALKATGLPMLGINTRRGDGSFGLSALPHKVSQARAAIDEAIAYAEAIDARAIHVMAGMAQGSDAHATFVENLRYASHATRRTLLIEPLNTHDAPGYFVRTTAQALDILAELNLPNVKLMFDCYHVQRTEGDVITHLRRALPSIGHIQFAGAPHRGHPLDSELDYRFVFKEIHRLGYPAPLGAEYKPDGATGDSLAWMSALRDVN